MKKMNVSKNDITQATIAKKYEFTGETRVWCGRTLRRIRALRPIAGRNVKAGDLGGWIENETNLSHDGSAWVYDDALVYDDAHVYGDARVYDDALVYGRAQVCGDAQVYGSAQVCDSARVYGDMNITQISDHMTVGPIGSRIAFTTFALNKDGEIKVACGCFFGNIEEFLAQVEKTHGDSKHGRAYRAAVQLALEQLGSDTEEVME